MTMKFIVNFEKTLVNFKCGLAIIIRIQSIKFSQLINNPLKKIISKQIIA